MKKILIIVENIGGDNSEQTDLKVKDYIKENDKSELYLYCDKFLLSKVGEYIRLKGVKIYSRENMAGEPMPKNNYDLVITVDDWAKNKSGIDKGKGIIKEVDTEKNNLKKDYKINYNNEKIADIVIPHHDRHDMLERLYNCIDITLFNVIVKSGGSFGHNCNQGAKIAETKKIIFSNDDIVISNEQLIKITNMLDNYDIVGTTQIAGEKRLKYWGIGLFKNDDKTIRHQISTTKENSIMPSGFLFGVNKKIWKQLKGFDERFKTGNEDVDFGLRVMESGYTIKILDLEIEHSESQSTGRMDNCDENEKLFYKIWKKKLKNIYKNQ